MPFTTAVPFRRVSTLIFLVGIMVGFTACAKLGKVVQTTPPSPIDFSQALQYAQRSALVYESDAAIRQNAPPDTTVTIMPQTAAGVKAYVETDEKKKIQWVVVRGTSNLVNVNLDVDYNKDEEPFRHFGPEVVLKDDTNYAYFAEPQAERFSVMSFWTALGNQQPPDHPIANYIQSLQAKTVTR